MPYNSYFPAGYQSYYPQYNYVQPQQMVQQNQQPAQQQTQQPMTSGIIWVQGESGAKSYLVAPNNTVQLWDSERQTIYIKSADASGMPSIKTLDYTIRETAQNNVSLAAAPDTNAFATKDEVSTLANQIKALRSDVEGLSRSRRSEWRSKEEVVSNE